MNKGYRVSKPGGALGQQNIQLEPLKPNEVAIKVIHCGVCRTDLDVVDGVFGKDLFPITPGHEIVGVVQSLGGLVTNVNVGDRVGVGWQSGACLSCSHCIDGAENYCEKKTRTCLEGVGGLSDLVHIDSRFVFRLPPKMKSEDAAPLMCAGLTVHSALIKCLTERRRRVGIVGLGGLGHLAVQYAKKLGKHVVVISSSDEKKSDAEELGAKEFILRKEFASPTSKCMDLDLILDTSSVWSSKDSCLRNLAAQGHLCLLGTPPTRDHQVSASAMSLISGSLSISGRNTGSRADMEAMLQFTVDNNIVPWIERYPRSQASRAFEHVREGKAKYRVVLVT